MNATAAQKHLLMLGAGRANLHTLRSFAEQHTGEVRITFVAPHPFYTDPAMLGDYVAGSLTLDDCRRPLQALLESVGAEPIGSTPQELATHLNKELDRWGKLIKERNIRLD